MKLKHIISLLSIVIGFCLFDKSPRNGLDNIFIIPLTYGIATYVWGNIYEIKKGFGGYIFLLISIIRYLVQPILIVATDGQLNPRMPNALASSYRIAIIIYILECVVSFYTMSKYYDKEKKLFLCDKSYKSLPIYQFNIIGWLFIAMIMSILLYRIGIWLPELKILGVKEGIDKGLVLDASLFNVMKGIFFVYFLYKAKIKRNRTFLIFAIVLGLFNFLSYFGQNRSFILETAITTIFVFIQSYPQYKKRIISFFTPFALLIVVIMYIKKQFGVETQADFNTLDDTVGIVEYSNIIEEYVNGLWTVARSYQASINLPIELSFSALIKDFFDGLQSLRDIPYLKTEIFPLMDNLLSSSDIFKLSLRTPFEYAQMLSFSGGLFIIGGTILGWPLMVLGNYLMIRLLVRMDVRSIYTKNLYYKYIYIWMSCLMGLIHCYCMQTIIFCWSKYILFFWLILFINNKAFKKNGK